MKPSWFEFVFATAVSVSVVALTCATAQAALHPPTQATSPGPVRWTIQPLPSPATDSARLGNWVRGADQVLYMTWVEDHEDKTSSLRMASWGPKGWSVVREIVRSSDLFLNWADFPGLGALSDGSLLAHWLKSDGTRSGYSAQVSISIDAGENWSPAQRLHEDRESGEHGFVSVLPLNHHQFLVTWLDGRQISAAERSGKADTGAMNLYSRTIDKTGELGPERLIDERVCDCCQPSLMGTPGGQALVGYRDRSATEVRDISISQRGPDGWSEPRLLHKDGWYMPGCPVNGPQLVRTSTGSCAAWFTAAGAGAGHVYVACAPVGQPNFGFPVTVDNGSAVGRVDIEALADDRTLVVWLEQTEGSRAEWRAQVVADGARLGASEALGEVPHGRASGFCRLAEGDNAVLAVWTVPGQPSSLEIVRIEVLAEQR